MKRRSVLSGISVGTISALAGCSTQSVSVGDADGDGVPNTEDYAPRDPTVQEETEILKVIVSDPNNPDAGTTVSSKEELIRHDPQRAYLQNQFIEITDLTPSTLSVSNTKFIDTHAESVIGVLREYPRGNIVSIQSDLIEQSSNTYSVDALFESDSSTPENTAVYVQLYIQNGDSTYEYVTESNPFTYTSETITPLQGASFDRKEPFDNSAFKRSLVEGGYIIEYTARYKNINWGVNFFISNSLYSSRLQTTRGRSRIEYARLLSSLGLIKTLNAGIRSEARRKLSNPTEKDVLHMTIDFVQSIPYVSDSIGAGIDDYSKFATETLVDLSGDCEDSTILLGALLAEQGHPVTFIKFPNHVGIGIQGPYEGSTIEYLSEEYYYIETTSFGWTIGDIPEELLNSTDIQIEKI